MSYIRGMLEHTDIVFRTLPPSWGCTVRLRLGLAIRLAPSIREPAQLNISVVLGEVQSKGTFVLAAWFAVRNVDRGFANNLAGPAHHSFLLIRPTCLPITIRKEGG